MNAVGETIHAHNHLRALGGIGETRENLVDAVAGETPLPGSEALEIIARLDPHNLRAGVIRDNPPARPGE